MSCNCIITVKYQFPVSQWAISFLSYLLLNQSKLLFSELYVTDNPQITYGICFSRTIAVLTSCFLDLTKKPCLPFWWHHRRRLVNRNRRISPAEVFCLWLWLIVHFPIRLPPKSTSHILFTDRMTQHSCHVYLNENLLIWNSLCFYLFVMLKFSPMQQPSHINSL